MKKNSHQLPVLLYILRTVFSRRMTRLILGVGSIVGALVFFAQFFPWFSVEYTTRNDPFMWFFCTVWWIGVLLLLSLIKPRVLMYGSMLIVLYIVVIYVYKAYSFNGGAMRCGEDGCSVRPNPIELFLTMPIVLINDPRLFVRVFHDFIPINYPE